MSIPGDQWVETDQLILEGSRLHVEWEGWRRGFRVYRRYCIHAPGVGRIWLYKGDGFNFRDSDRVDA